MSRRDSRKFYVLIPESIFTQAYIRRTTSMILANRKVENKYSI